MASTSVQFHHCWHRLITVTGLCTTLLGGVAFQTAGPLGAIAHAQPPSRSPQTITGRLSATSPVLDADGSFYETHTFTGSAGETLRLDLRSDDFDAYLFLLDPAGNEIGQDDDGGDGTHARLWVTLPATGTYTLVVNSFGPGETGRYQLQIAAATATEQGLAQAEQLYQAAIALYQAGRYTEAISRAETVLALHRQHLAANHPELATSLNGLAVLYRTQGRYDEAEPLYLEALTIRRQQFGDDHPEVAASLNNLATLYLAQGRYGEAEPLFLEALDQWRQQLGDDHPRVATNLSNLALLYRSQGRYGEAEPLFVEALAIRRQQFGNDHPEVAASLNNLALLYQSQQRYGEAEPLFVEALDLWRQRVGNDHPDVASSLNNLAVLYWVQGRYGETEPLLLEAYAIRRQMLGDTHPDVAQSLNNLAEIYRVQGRYGEAEPLYRQALNIWQQQLGEHHPEVATSFQNLAYLYWAQGNGPAAIPFQQASLAIEERHLALNLAALGEAQRQDYAATLTGSTDITLSLHLQGAAASPEAAAMALTTLLRRKGRILEAGVNSLQRLRQNLSPADQTLLDELTAARQRLAALTFNPSPTLDRAEVGRLEERITQLEADLARRSAVFRLETLPVDIAAVQARLPRNGVLIEYARYRAYDPTADRQAWGEERYAAYLLFPEGHIEAVDLGPAAAIDGAVADFMGRLQDRRAIPPSGALQRLILEPIAPALAGRTQLLISPDGQLNLIPFEALQSAAGEPFLVEQYRISYLSSGRDLLRFDVNAPSQQSAVVLANPDYGQGAQAAGRRDLRQLRVGPLPGTAAEAQAIAPLLPNATILTGADATETALKRVQAPEILHLATHGFFLADVQRPEPTGRGLGLVAAGDAGLAPPPAGVAVENPLLRSGLALAGFNTRTSGNEDGVLTALEVAGLDLIGTRLVVLSACETGVGEVANGEGVYGLRRAFALAGAEAQLLSLWQVDDLGTQRLMTRYYEKLTAGMGRSEALRQVQLEMIAAGDRFSHPFYWAAFVLTGDWRSLQQ